MLPIYRTPARGILTATTGFIAEAGFTHSLTPARNCTFGCTYCYVPTMRVLGGLQAEDWKRWGQFTTFKQNAAELLQRELRSDQIIYCSPVVDPYQPAEEQECIMPALLDTFTTKPPRVLTLQTRGPLILRDLDRLVDLASRTTLRVSFSVSTNVEQVRRWFEPHCPTFETRLDTMRALRRAGLQVFATLAPILPCDPELLAAALVDATGNDVIGDPLHVRATKRHGATTNGAAIEIARRRGFDHWLDPSFQAEIVSRLTASLRSAGRRFGVGPDAFSWLAAGPNSR